MMRSNWGCNSGSPPVRLTGPWPNSPSASSTTASTRSGSSECTVVTSSRMQWGQRRLQCCVSAKPSSMLEHRAPAPSRASPAADRGAGLQRQVREWGQLHHLWLHPHALGVAATPVIYLIWRDVVFRLAHGSSVESLLCHWFLHSPKEFQQPRIARREGCSSAIPTHCGVALPLARWERVFHPTSHATSLVRHYARARRGLHRVRTDADRPLARAAGSARPRVLGARPGTGRAVRPHD